MEPPAAIFRLDPESGELLYINRRAEQLLGIAQSFACAHPDCLRAAHADEADRQSFDEALQAARGAALGLRSAVDPARRQRAHGQRADLRAH